MPRIDCSIIEVCIFSFGNTEPLYLMLRRSKTETLYPDAWQIVTGALEPGETALQGALRELKEETGFAPEKLWIVPHMNTFYSVAADTVHHTVIFAAQVAAETNPVLSEEHYQFQWLPIRKAQELCVWPGQVTALEIVHKYIAGGKTAAAVSEIPL